MDYLYHCIRTVVVKGSGWVKQGHSVYEISVKKIAPGIIISTFINQTITAICILMNNQSAK